MTKHLPFEEWQRATYRPGLTYLMASGNPINLSMGKLMQQVADYMTYLSTAPVDNCGACASGCANGCQVVKDSPPVGRELSDVVAVLKEIVAEADDYEQRNPLKKISWAERARAVLAVQDGAA